MADKESGHNCIHVIEPTLVDYAGHCYSLARSFCDASRLHATTIWAGRGAQELDFPPETIVRPHFNRRFRLFQLYWNFRRLLRSPGRVLVLTARRIDLSLLDWAVRGQIPPGKVFLYFHWYRETPKRLDFLEKAARAQPHITILATTESLAELFHASGFRAVVWLPYPLTARAPASSSSRRFRHLLYPGAARQDKGFGKVVDLVEHLRTSVERLPISVQFSADHYGKYDDHTRKDVERLHRCSYPGLTALAETLPPERYAALYEGAICLQPYDPSDFRDRVSGITMDALAYGSPVIAPDGTWMGRLVQATSAGVVVNDFKPTTLLSAALKIREDYERYSECASRAGQKLRDRSWDPLLSIMQ